MARFEELEVSADVFEPSSNSSRLIVPLMEEYPSPTNTFDVFLGNDGTSSGGSGNNVDFGQFAEGVGAVIGSVIASRNQDGTRKMLRQRCGRRPLLRKNRGEYDKCSERFFRELQGLDSKSEGGISNEQLLELLKRDSPKKSKIGTAGVIGIVLGVVAVGTAIYFVSRKK